MIRLILLVEKTNIFLESYSVEYNFYFLDVNNHILFASIKHTLLKLIDICV